MDTVFVVVNLAECKALYVGDFLKCYFYLRTVQAIAYNDGIVILKYSDWLRMSERGCVYV